MLQVVLCLDRSEWYERNVSTTERRWHSEMGQEAQLQW